MATSSTFQTRLIWFELFAVSFHFLLDRVFPTMASGLFVTELERSDGHKFTCEVSNYYDQFSSNLSHWKDFRHSWSPSSIDKLTATHHHPFYYDRIQIFNGTLNYERSDYWSEDHNASRFFPEVYFSDTIDHILDYFQYLLNSYEALRFLPDVDFIVHGTEYYYNWPGYFEKDYPIFRYENSHPDRALDHAWLLPPRAYLQWWHILGWSQSLQALTDESIDTDTDIVSNDARVHVRLSDLAMTPWSERIDKALFRGKVYIKSRVRYSLLQMLVRHGEESKQYFDVKMLLATKDVENDTMLLDHWDEFVLLEENRMNEADQMRYKFVIVPDGSVSADRVEKQLLYGSVMLKQVTKFNTEFFYDLEPYKHFIPWTDPEDLWDKVKFYFDAINNNLHKKEDRDEMTRYLTYVGLNGMKAVMREFSSDHMDCHTINMLHLYANTFKKTRIGKVTLKEKISVNNESAECWLQNNMNKTIVINENTTNYRDQVRWPVPTVDKSLLEQVEKLIEETGIEKLKDEYLDRFKYDKIHPQKSEMSQVEMKQLEKYGLEKRMYNLAMHKVECLDHTRSREKTDSLAKIKNNVLYFGSDWISKGGHSDDSIWMYAYLLFAFAFCVGIRFARAIRKMSAS